MESETADKSIFRSKPTIPKHRHDLLKWNGWGYQDSKFIVDSKTNNVTLSGPRYNLSGKKLTNMIPFMKRIMGISLDLTSLPTNFEIKADMFPPAVANNDFIEDIIQNKIDHSFDDQDRLFRGHGHTIEEIFNLRYGKFDKIPDIVLWPTSQKEVETVINLAVKWNVVIIPFGGGTSVSGGVLCPQNEKRMIASLDTSQMNKTLWVDKNNMTACIEAGIIGQDLDKRLSQMGVCVGHEPDSMEFSSLGGWVATRASGMKKNLYGNIEDLLVAVSMVTPQGIVRKYCQGPRISSGPDVFNFVLGSEGTLGVITEVTLKIQTLPEVQKFDSLVFPNFEAGVACLREIALQKCVPASIRLMDNLQFQFGHALKPETASIIDSVMDAVKKCYLTFYKGYNLNEMAVATLLFEGSAKAVKQQENEIYDIASKYQGISGGEENGRRGYMLTYAIAYLRDLGLDYYCIGESFETSVPWDRVLDLCRNVKDKIKTESLKHGISYPVFSTCRVTQIYDAGVCVYFYFGFNYRGIKEPFLVYEDIENKARSEILASGGSISHHHGVGKIRKSFLSQTLSPTAIKTLAAIKTSLDPLNIFACDNIISNDKCIPDAVL